MELLFLLVLLHSFLSGAAEGETANHQVAAMHRRSARAADRSGGGGKRTLRATTESSVGVEFTQCLSHKIESILTRTATGSVEGCQTRPTVIPLPKPQAEYSHVIPTHYQVDRCSGSCMNSHHTCVPSTKRTIKVPVMLSLRSAAPGRTPTVCAETEVEEHLTCVCGCHMTADECSDDQFFLAEECRCTCGNAEARDSCLARGWFWNQDTCTCMCPNMPYPTCPSGYAFDLTESCKCKAVSGGGGSSAFIELMVVLASVVTMSIIFTLIHCHRKKIGLFKAREEMRYRTSSFMVHVRTLSDRLDSTASRIRVPSGNGVWDNNRTVKVVGISRIKSGNNRRRGECCDYDDADELVQLHRNESSEEVENLALQSRRESQIECRRQSQSPIQVRPQSPVSPKQKTVRYKPSVETESEQKPKHLFLESDDERVKPYRTFTV